LSIANMPPDICQRIFLGINFPLSRHNFSVLRIAALAALVLTLVPAGAAATQSANGRARLQVTQGATLVIRGANFVRGERVRLTITANSVVRKRAVANRRGMFLVQAPVFFDRCTSALRVVAVGSRGSRAMVKLPQAVCPPRL
jgi:hypothetical protein